MINSFEYLSVNTIDDAVKEIGSTFIAGGTDLVPLMKCEVKKLKKIVNIEAVKELKEIKIQGGYLFIGSGATLREIQNNEYIQENFKALSFSARCVASPQIRNIGTIGGNIMQDRRCIYFNQSDMWRESIDKCFKTGGNICHQAPISKVCRAPYYSDVATALCVYDTQVEYYNESGLNKADIQDFLLKHADVNGIIETEKRFITGFYLPISKGVGFSEFIKKSVRDSIDFPIFNAAVYAGKDEVKIAVGAINKNPIRLTETEAFIKKNKKNLQAVAEGIKAAAIAEINKKAVLVKEDVISVKVKKNSFNSIFELIDKVICMMSE